MPVSQLLLLKACTVISRLRRPCDYSFRIISAILHETPNLLSPYTPYTVSTVFSSIANRIRIFHLRHLECLHILGLSGGEEGHQRVD